MILKVKKLILYFIFTILSINLSFAEEIKFAQLSDIHTSNEKSIRGARLLPYSYQILNDALLQTKREKDVDFIAITGDGINLPQKKLANEFIKIMNHSKIPYFWSFGNHDVSKLACFDSCELLKISNSKNKHFKLNNIYDSFDYKKDFKIIVLNAVIETKPTSSGYIDKNQLCFLKKTLNEVKAKNQIPLIFIHHPINPPYCGSKHHEIKNKEEIISILENFNKPTIVFQGHYHIPKTEKLNNVLYVSSPSLIQYPNAFRIININRMENGKIFIKLETKRTNLKEYSKISYEKTKNKDLYEIKDYEEYEF